MSTEGTDIKVFKDQDKAYQIDFKLITSVLNKQCAGFLAKEIVTDFYKSSKVYKTKDEAIDATIKHLERLRNEIEK